jgi:hypothetical protein
MPKIVKPSSFKVSHRSGLNKNANTAPTSLIRPRSYGPMSKYGIIEDGFGVKLFGDWDEFRNWLGLGYYKKYKAGVV